MRATPKRRAVGTIQFDVHLIAEDAALRGWSSSELARRAEVSGMTVLRVFRGERQTPGTIAKLADALGYSVRRYLISSRKGCAA
jgi:transcriptional regulator with XRE-family HTH domain